MALTIKPADIIKAKVIDFLIENFEGVVIGDEIMYGSSHKIVDLLALHAGETYAIEIKSSQDDLRRLPEQLTEYSKLFDHTLVFTTTDHYENILKVINGKVSVFVVGSVGQIEGQLKEHRNNVVKGEMLATMSAVYIRKRLNITNAKDSDDVRKRAMKHKKEVIHSVLYEYFMEKLSEPFALFISERGDVTEVDDIILLTNRMSIG